MNRPPDRAAPPITVAARFWLGMALPAVSLGGAVVLLAIASRGADPALATLFLSLVAVPATLLCNGWVLFVDWPDRRRLLLAGHALPACIVLAALVFVAESGAKDGWGLKLLMPLFVLMEVTLSLPLAALATWAIALLVMVLLARRRAARGARPA